MDLSKVNWHKSSRSNESGDNCVEVAGAIPFVVLRDSKDPNGPKIILSRDDFREFANLIRSL